MTFNSLNCGLHFINFNNNNNNNNNNVDDDDNNNNNNNLVITFVQDIYKYILETNHVSRVYSVAVVLYLQFVLHVMLFRP